MIYVRVLFTFLSTQEKQTCAVVLAVVVGAVVVSAGVVAVALAVCGSASGCK